MHWLLLASAVILETIGTTTLKISDGFSKPWPSLVSVVTYAVSIWLLAVVLRTVPVGIAYAIWAGLGICLIALIGLVAFGQRLDLPAIVGLALIIAGIVVINLFSTAAPH